VGQPAERGDGNARFRIGRVLPVLAIAALVVFAPAVIAKGQNDGWHWNDLPGLSHEPEVVGVSGPAMRSACRRLPRVALGVAPDGLDVGRAWFTLACQPPPSQPPAAHPNTDTSSVAVR
jgi:hypothetical protein